MGSEITRADPAVLQAAVVHGDLSKMSPTQRTEYYSAVCQSLGLNPLTQPFKYLRLNGKEVLYATRDAADQLRKMHRVSVRIVSRVSAGDLYIVSARATLPDGREDESTGVLPIKGLRGEQLSNALMKCETKAKRRVTLSICGLGWLDETEVDSIDGAQRVEGHSARVPANAAMAAQYEESSAIAEEQARERNRSDAWLEAVLPDIEAIADDDSLFRWIRLNALEAAGLHTSAKGRLWTALRKAATRAGVSHADTGQALQDCARDAVAEMDGEGPGLAKVQPVDGEHIDEPGHPPDVDPDPVIRFGNLKGARARAILRSGGSLDWYMGAVRDSIEDPNKARWRDDNERHLEALRAVLLDFDVPDPEAEGYPHADEGAWPFDGAVGE